MKPLQKVRKNKKLQQGVVVGNGMEKTATVLVERTTKHPLYKKTIKLSKKFPFHDPENSCNVGDFSFFIFSLKIVFALAIDVFSILHYPKQSLFFFKIEVSFTVPTAAPQIEEKNFSSNSLILFCNSLIESFLKSNFFIATFLKSHCFLQTVCSGLNLTPF